MMVQLCQTFTPTLWCCKQFTMHLQVQGSSTPCFSCSSPVYSLKTRELEVMCIVQVQILVAENFSEIAENDVNVSFGDKNFVIATFFVIIVTPLHATLWSHIQVSVQRHFQQHFDSVHTFANTNTNTCTPSVACAHTYMLCQPLTLHSMYPRPPFHNSLIPVRKLFRDRRSKSQNFTEILCHKIWSCTVYGSNRWWLLLTDGGVKCCVYDFSISVVRLSSPRLNIVLIFGTVLLYFSVCLHVYSSTSTDHHIVQTAICNVRNSLKPSVELFLYSSSVLPATALCALHCECLLGSLQSIFPWIHSVLCRHSLQAVASVQHLHQTTS